MYWLVYFGFLYTLVDHVLSGPGVTRLPRKGTELSGYVPSTVNWMAWLDRCDVLLRILHYVTMFCITKLASLYLFLNLGGFWLFC